ncbi:MAG: hypothetical protein WCR42_01205 [bacterium]
MIKLQSIDYHPEFEQLKHKLEDFKSELMVLIVKRDNMIYHQKFLIENEFFRLLGPEKVESAYLELEVRKLKFTIDLIQMDLNRNILPNLTIIGKMVDTELLDWEAKLLDMKAKLLGSIIVEGNLMTPEEAREFKALYRELVKKLHPDMVEDFNDECKMLWESVQHAFKNGDLNSLRSFCYLLKSQDFQITPNQNDIEFDILNLEMQINILNLEITAIDQKYPFNLVDKISDSDWVENERYRLQTHITEYLDQIEQLNYQLNKMKVIINGQFNQN